MGAASNLALDLARSSGGVALLELIEREVRNDGPWHQPLADVDTAVVVRAVAVVEGLDLAGLLRLALDGLDRIGGPWNPEAVTRLEFAFALAQDRVDIAEAVASRFGAALHAPFDRHRQELWITDPSEGRGWRPFGGFESVYCCGEFPLDGLWTVTAPDSTLHEILIGTWEMYGSPVT